MDTEEGTDPAKQDPNPFTAITSQADLDKIIGDRIARERGKYADYDDLKTKAAEFDKAAESSKSEVQKAIERAEKAERDLAATQGEKLRLEVGSAKGLTPAQARRLVGSTREDLEADADALLADFAPAKGGGTKPPMKSLKSGSAGDDSQLTGKERAAAALRQLRGN